MPCNMTDGYQCLKSSILKMEAADFSEALVCVSTILQHSHLGRL
jgi:hypothetical protein